MHRKLFNSRKPQGGNSVPRSKVWLWFAFLMAGMHSLKCNSKGLLNLGKILMQYKLWLKPIYCLSYSEAKTILPTGSPWYGMMMTVCRKISFETCRSIWPATLAMSSLETLFSCVEAADCQSVSECQWPESWRCVRYISPCWPLSTLFTF